MKKKLSYVLASLLVLFCHNMALATDSALNVLDYGFVANDPLFDNTPKLNALISGLGTTSTIYFPSGVYYFNSKPNVINKKVRIQGSTMTDVVLVRNYTPSNYLDSLLHATDTVVIESLAIHAGQGTTGGGAIHLEGLGASASILRDLYITIQGGGSTANWEIPVTLYSSDSLGIRGCLLDNVEVFAATTHSVWLVNVKGLTARVNAYPAGGTVGHITVQDYSGYRSANIRMETRHLVSLYVYNTDYLTLSGLGNTSVYPSNSTNIRVY